MKMMPWPDPAQRGRCEILVTQSGIEVTCSIPQSGMTSHLRTLLSWREANHGLLAVLGAKGSSTGNTHLNPSLKLENAGRFIKRAPDFKLAASLYQLPPRVTLAFPLSAPPGFSSTALE